MLHKELIIREMSLDDCEFVNLVRNVYSEKFLHNSDTFTVEETISWYKTLSIPYYILLSGSDRIGYFRVSNYNAKNRNLYVGLDIHPSYINRGYGYIAFLFFIPFVFTKYRLNKVSAEILSTNLNSIKLYKKLGFTEEGIKRQEILKKEGFVDSVIMSLLEEELLNFQKRGHIYT